MSYNNYNYSDNNYRNPYLEDLQRTLTSSRFTSNAVDNIKMVGTNKIKNMFGKEFYISHFASLDNKINTKLVEFIKKYDANFNEHFDFTEMKILPFMTLIKLDWRTYIFMATKQNIPGRMAAAVMNDSMDADIYIYIMGKHSRKYIAELEAILNERSKGQRNDVIYSVNSVGGSAGTDISCINLSKRKMDSLIYSGDELKRIKDHMEKFLHGKEFYTEKELSYKTGILLYGKPGTGKSSLVKAIATEYGRGIISIDVSNIDNIDFARLTMMINNEDQETYIVLFEDIDTLFLNRQEAEQHDKNYNDIINKLLQFLDSNQSPSNVVFIATTNHLERLDEALIRDGRFDLKVEIDELKKEDISKFLKSFDMDPNLTDTIVEDYVASLKRNNPDATEPESFNQSRLQNIILQHIKFQSILQEDPTAEKPPIQIEDEEDNKE